MAFLAEPFRISGEEILQNGVVGMADVPGLTALEMQRRLDGLAAFLGTEKYNRLLLELGRPGSGVMTETEVRRAIGEAEFQSGGGDMQRNIYDPAGRGEDIFRYADEIRQYAEKAGAGEYTHSRAGTVHALAGSGEHIEFTASADYLDGDTFTLNGTAAPAMLQNGLPLPDRYFRAGSAAACRFLFGNLYFAGTSTWKLLWSGKWSDGSITVPGLSRYRRYMFVTEAGYAAGFAEGSRSIWGSGGLGVAHAGSPTNYHIGILLDRVGETLQILALQYFRITAAGNQPMAATINRIYGIA